jgi:2-oxoglutarate ferredoxin oxidoreductase subunit delta
MDVSAEEDSSPLKVIIDQKKCKSDGLCVDLCPVSVFQIKVISTQPKKTRTVIANEAACVLCRICEVNCPNQAIKIMQQEL